MITQSHYNTLLVTPDHAWSQLLEDQLRQNGFAPLTVAPTCQHALTLFHQTTLQLALLDIRLTDCQMSELCTTLHRTQPAVKIILITEINSEAPPTALTGSIAGCIGRNLPLPAWPGVLTYIAQDGAAMSQQQIATALLTAKATQRHKPPLVIGALTIDLTQCVAFYAGERLFLTPREFTLLAYLAAHPDHVVTVDQLLSDAWGYDTEHGAPAQVRLYMTRLRRKLASNAPLPDFIHTVRGGGYRLDSTFLR